MKKVFLISVLSFISFVTIGQKVYSNKTDYINAIKEYNNKMESYLNYTKKLNYLKNFSHFPAIENYPKTQHGWTLFLEPYFLKENIKCDNPKNRFHPNVTPDGTMFINFYHYPNTTNIVVSTSKERVINDPNCLYSADYFIFNHPGKGPIYVDSTSINTKKMIEPSASRPLVKEVKVTKKHIVYVPPVKLDIYFMPDGLKYTYEQLIHCYPSMANKLVFDNHFKKDLTNDQ